MKIDHHAVPCIDHHAVHFCCMYVHIPSRYKNGAFGSEPSLSSKTRFGA